MVSIVSILLNLSVLLAPAFSAELPECEKYRPVREPVNQAYPKKTAADGFEFIQDCTRGTNFARVEASAQAKNFLKGFSQQVGAQLPVYSCFRSQVGQDFILCNNKCAPRFGDVECSGRIAANKSEHTEGTAADFKIKVNVPENSPNRVLDPEVARHCRVLDAVRKKFAGGRGGITIYGIGPDSIAFAHYDTKPDWCNWGGCEKIGPNEILGEGHCKRKKFSDKEARLEQGLAAAKEMKALADIRRLEAELKRLRADCPPGDLTCRDSFKD